jgi:hypothetical protein
MEPATNEMENENSDQTTKSNHNEERYEQEQYSRHQSAPAWCRYSGAMPFFLFVILLGVPFLGIKIVGGSKTVDRRPHSLSVLMTVAELRSSMFHSTKGLRKPCIDLFSPHGVIICKDKQTIEDRCCITVTRLYSASQ